MNYYFELNLFSELDDCSETYILIKNVHKKLLYDFRRQTYSVHMRGMEHFVVIGRKQAIFGITWVNNFHFEGIVHPNMLWFSHSCVVSMNFFLFLNIKEDILKNVAGCQKIKRSNCLATKFSFQQKKEIHTGLEQLEGKGQIVHFWFIYFKCVSHTYFFFWK